MQYKVPQNIDMEDKIFGPLTLIQFAELLIGGAIIYIFFSSLSFAGFVIFGLPVALLTFALVFLKIQNQPFHQFLLAFFNYLLNPRRRIWHKATSSSPAVLISPPQKAPRQKRVIAHKIVSREQIKKLSSRIDQLI